MPRAKGERSEDVKSENPVDFSELLLPEPIQRALNEAGFYKPSPVQLRAIPLARFGLDLIAQAKSGTGKTCVFAVVACEQVDTSSHRPQVIILEPTREIALQSRDVIMEVGKYLEDFTCHAFIGGTAIAQDCENLRWCHVAVGTPGRMRALIESGDMRVDHVKVVVMDEADSLFSESFRDDIIWILQALPERRQTLAFSATFPPLILDLISRFMNNPQHVQLVTETAALKAVRQYYTLVPTSQRVFEQYDHKLQSVISILSRVPFHQCLVFTNLQGRAEQFAEVLTRKGWPAKFISGKQQQDKRTSTMTALREFEIRVLVSTDLTARGVDVDRVNLVLNIDLPGDPDTYLHRVGRAGRYGGKGLAVAVITSDELKTLEAYGNSHNFQVSELPEEISAEEVEIELDEAEQEKLGKLEAKRERAVERELNGESDSSYSSSGSCSTNCSCGNYSSSESSYSSDDNGQIPSRRSFAKTASRGPSVHQRQRQPQQQSSMYPAYSPYAAQAAYQQHYAAMMMMGQTPYPYSSYGYYGYPQQQQQQQQQQYMQPSPSVSVPSAQPLPSYYYPQQYQRPQYPPQQQQQPLQQMQQQRTVYPPSVASQTRLPVRYYQSVASQPSQLFQPGPPVPQQRSRASRR